MNQDENLWACDTRVNEEYMNENDPMNKMSKKHFKELKVSIYTKKVYVPFRWYDHKNSMVKYVLLEVILCWMTF